MNDYKVTRFVSNLGYFVGIGLVVLCGIGGFISSKSFFGLIGGVLLGAVLCVPFLMVCEGMHALVTIANNTKKNTDRPEQKLSA